MHFGLKRVVLTESLPKINVLFFFQEYVQKDEQEQANYGFSADWSFKRKKNGHAGACTLFDSFLFCPQCSSMSLQKQSQDEVTMYKLPESLAVRGDPWAKVETTSIILYAVHHRQKCHGNITPELGLQLFL